VVVVACMLHNICLLAQDGNEQIMQDSVIEKVDDTTVDAATVAGHSSDAAKQKRKRIIASLSGQ